MKRTSFWGVSSRRSCRSSQNHSTSTTSVLLVGDIDLDYCDTEWFAFETNRNHSVVFETASKYCILASFVDYDGYSILSKGFLPTVPDIMLLCQKKGGVQKILKQEITQVSLLYHLKKPFRPPSNLRI